MKYVIQLLPGMLLIVMGSLVVDLTTLDLTGAGIVILGIVTLLILGCYLE